jgi:hypothetical protein
MEASAALRREWTFAQWGLVVLATVQLLWATAGLIAEPSIDFGEGAVTKQVLGVDFNGVHALSGYLLFLPAYYFALRPRWALYYCAYVAAALWATGIWALFDHQPAYVFTFPTTTPTPTSTWRPAPCSRSSRWSRSRSTVRRIRHPYGA